MNNILLLGMPGGAEIIIILIVLVTFLIIPIIALIDILKNKFEGNNKIIWVLLILFLGLIGVFLYYTIGKKQKII